MAKSFEQLIEVIRDSSVAAEDKKVAAAVIGLRLLRNQAAGGTLGNINAEFNSANPEHFGDTIAKIQSTIENL